MKLIDSGTINDMMAEEWWYKLKGKERILYEEFRTEMMKEKGNRFPEECPPSEWKQLFEKWKMTRYKIK